MAINKVKQWKATGIEGIPNEISKSFILFHIQFELFKTCFESGKIPYMWSKSIINRILKKTQ